MAEQCPDAWLLNYTNPMAMLCWATYDGSPIHRVVGLCHSVQWTTRGLAELVGVAVDEVDYLVAGVNHLAWILQLAHRGRDLYPLLDEAIERDPEPAAARPRRDVSPARVLPHRVERARRRVPAVVHANATR